MAIAWSVDPEVGVSLLARFQVPSLKDTVAKLVLQHPTSVMGHDVALKLLVEECRNSNHLASLKVCICISLTHPSDWISTLWFGMRFRLYKPFAFYKIERTIRLSCNMLTGPLANMPLRLLSSLFLSLYKPYEAINWVSVKYVG